MTKEPVTNKWGDAKTDGGLNVYILYDRSGSMRPKQDEAVPAMNAYVEALAPDTVVTIVAFDNQDPHLVIRDHVRVRDYRPVEIGVVEARGMTPLYDATGWIIDQIFQDNPFAPSWWFKPMARKIIPRNMVGRPSRRKWKI